MLRVFCEQQGLRIKGIQTKKQRSDRHMQASREYNRSLQGIFQWREADVARLRPKRRAADIRKEVLYVSCVRRLSWWGSGDCNESERCRSPSESSYCATG